MARPKPDDVSIGKFDVLATNTFAKALLDGITEDEAKQRGMVAAIMGAQAEDTSLCYVYWDSRIHARRL